MPIAVFISDRDNQAIVLYEEKFYMGVRGFEFLEPSEFDLQPYENRYGGCYDLGMFPIAVPSGDSTKCGSFTVKFTKMDDHVVGEARCAAASEYICGDLDPRMIAVRYEYKDGQFRKITPFPDSFDPLTYTRSEKRR